MAKFGRIVSFLLTLHLEYAFSGIGVPFFDGGRVDGIIQCTTLCMPVDGFESLPCVPTVQPGQTLEDICDEDLQIGILNLADYSKSEFLVELTWTTFEDNYGVRESEVHSTLIRGLDEGWTNLTDSGHDMHLQGISFKGCLPGRLSLKASREGDSRSIPLAQLDLLPGGPCGTQDKDVELNVTWAVFGMDSVRARKNSDGHPFLDLTDIVEQIDLRSNDDLPDRSMSLLKYSVVGYLTSMDYAASDWGYDPRNHYCGYPRFSLNDHPVMYRFHDVISAPGDIYVPKPQEVNIPLDGQHSCPMCGYMRLTLQFDPLFDVYDSNLCNNYAQIDFYADDCEDEQYYDYDPVVQLMPDVFRNGHSLIIKSCEMHYTQFHKYEAFSNMWQSISSYDMYMTSYEDQAVTRLYLLASGIMHQYREKEMDICAGLDHTDRSAGRPSCNLTKAPECGEALMEAREWMGADMMPSTKDMQDLKTACAADCMPVLDLIDAAEMYMHNDTMGDAWFSKMLWMMGLGSPEHGICPNPRLMAEFDMMNHPGEMMAHHVSRLLDMFQRDALGLNPPGSWQRSEKMLKDPMMCAYDRANHLIHLPYALLATQDVRNDEFMYMTRDFYQYEFAGEMARATNMSTEYLRRCLLPTGTEPVKGLPAVFYAAYDDNVVAKSFYNYFTAGDMAAGDPFRFTPIGMIKCPYCGDSPDGYGNAQSGEAVEPGSTEIREPESAEIDEPDKKPEIPKRKRKKRSTASSKTPPTVTKERFQHDLKKKEEKYKDSVKKITESVEKLLHNKNNEGD